MPQSGPVSPLRICRRDALQAKIAVGGRTGGYNQVITCIRGCPVHTSALAGHRQPVRLALCQGSILGQHGRISALSAGPQCWTGTPAEAPMSLSLSPEEPCFLTHALTVPDSFKRLVTVVVHSQLPSNCHLEDSHLGLASATKRSHIRLLAVRCLVTCWAAALQFNWR